jgi:DHA1 family bicyclomycin/chloramphenicol resistance-like MFS transporter
MKLSNPESYGVIQQSVPLRRILLGCILGLLAMIGPLSTDMYLPALPAIATDYHTTASHVQLSLTLFLLGLALGQLVYGPISDMYGRRIPLLIGLIVYVATTLICAFSPSIWTLILVRFIQGMAGAAAIVISKAIVYDLFSGKQLTKYFSLLMMCIGIGPIIAPILGGQMLLHTSWKGIFILLCCIGMIMFLSVIAGLKESLPAHKRSENSIILTFLKFAKLIRNRRFMGCVLVQSFNTAALFAYISGSSFVMQEIFGVSPQMFSLIFAVNGVGLIAASLIVRRLIERISEKRLLVSGILIAWVGGLALLISLVIEAGLAGILPSCFLIVSSVGVVGPTSTSLALQTQGKSAGSAAALLGVISMLFGAVTSPLVGLGGGITALPMGIVIALASFGSIVCYFFLIRAAPGTSV